MKILELNGFKYSRGAFDGYEIRCKVEFKTLEDRFDLDIYTTDTDKERVREVLLERRHESVVALNIIHWSTKEQDDANTAFLDEFLKENL